MNWYSVTTRKSGTTCTTTSGTESTTMWTPITTLTTGRHSTSTITWRFTTCTFTNSSTERARVVLFLVHFIHTHIGSSSSLVRTPTHDHLHGHPRERSLFTLILSTLNFPTFLLSVFLSLQEQVLRERERPAPFRPEAVLARLVINTPTSLTFASPQLTHSYQERAPICWESTHPKRKAALWGVSWASFHKACGCRARAARWRSPPPTSRDYLFKKKTHTQSRVTRPREPAAFQVLIHFSCRLRLCEKESQSDVTWKRDSCKTGPATKLSSSP